jgi:cyanophycin synthetase
MVAHILKLAGKRVGLTTTDGIYIDGELYMRGDMTGPWSARMVLKDPTVDAAVLETARGGIVREGLGWDRCDVGAVLNVQADHLGLGGVNTVHELARIKSLVVEMVHRRGTSVLNADDPLVVDMRDEAGGRIAFFSMQEGRDGPEHLREHIAKGGLAVVLQKGARGDMLTIYDDEHYIPLLWAHLIPATLEGQARANIANALAATAMTYALGTPVETIRQALRTFTTSFYQTPGRLNVWDKLPFRVLMDYAHNPAALGEMSELVRRMRLKYKRVVGVLSGPGDRRDEDLRELGRLAQGMFDELVVKQDKRLRGRKEGEAAGLIRDGAIAAGMDPGVITTVLPELEAVRYALDHGRPGDLLVVFADEITAVWKTIIYYGTDGETDTRGDV